MSHLEELPLFPFNTVLFPYAQVVAPVFDPEQQAMIEACILEERPLGVVLAKEASESGFFDPHLVGTVARILGAERAESGALNLRIQGERRFRIRKIDDSSAFPIGLVEPVVEREPEDSPRSDALATRAREDFQHWIQLQIARNGLAVQIRFPEDLTALSFAIANFLPLDNQSKQRMLELTDTSERIAGLIPLLEADIAEFREPTLTKMTTADFAEWTSRN